MSAAEEFLAAYGEETAERERARADDATARAATAERALAFERAGVPVDRPMGALFERQYTGPVDESEIRLGWAYVTERPDELSDQERFVYEARLAGRNPRRSTR